MTPEEFVSDPRPTGRAEGSGCQLHYDSFNGDYDCLYYSNLTCDQCKFGGGEKRPSFCLECFG